MLQASTMAKSGLLDFLCRPPRESERDAALLAAAKTCLSIPGARRAWAKLEARTVEVPEDPDLPRYPYGVEVPIDIAGRVCGTVGLETEEPVNGSAHARAAAVADLLATWEARRCLMEASPAQTIVGCSAEIRHVELLARRFATLDEPVLIEGETGVGKELSVHSVHRLSHRGGQPLWTINCAAVPDELIASELFGHRRGSFTGAVRDQRGRFEMADGGTLFLDEIAAMGPKLQASLLRVIEYGEIQQIGDEGRNRMVNVRVVAVSNRDLAAETEAGRFRADLYYRLCPLTISVPPLRERPEDIPVLARFFVAELEQRWGQPFQLVSRAVEKLIDYEFPGNVRELRNLVLRAAATCCKGRIDMIPLPDLAEPFGPYPLGGGNGNGDAGSNGNGRRAPRPRRRKADAAGFGQVDNVTYLPSVGSEALSHSAYSSFPVAEGNGNGRTLALDEVTAAHLRSVLALAHGNVSQAARMLKIPRTTLQSKLRRYGVA